MTIRASRRATTVSLSLVPFNALVGLAASSNYAPDSSRAKDCLEGTHAYSAIGRHKRAHSRSRGSPALANRAPLAQALGDIGDNLGLGGGGAASGSHASPDGPSQTDTSSALAVPSRAAAPTSSQRRISNGASVSKGIRETETVNLSGATAARTAPVPALAAATDGLLPNSLQPALSETATGALFGDPLSSTPSFSVAEPVTEVASGLTAILLTSVMSSETTVITSIATLAASGEAATYKGSAGASDPNGRTAIAANGGRSGGDGALSKGAIAAIAVSLGSLVVLLVLFTSLRKRQQIKTRHIQPLDFTPGYARMQDGRGVSVVPMTYAEQRRLSGSRPMSGISDVAPYLDPPLEDSHEGPFPLAADQRRARSTAVDDDTSYITFGADQSSMKSHCDIGDADSNLSQGDAPSSASQLRQSRRASGDGDCARDRYDYRPELEQLRRPAGMSSVGDAYDGLDSTLGPSLRD
ncbi:unnamed protein product [Parajaminaea phylloscopi]